MEDVQLIHALQTRQDGATKRFQTAYTPLLQYIICLFSLSRKMDTPEDLTQEIFKIFYIIV